MRIKGDRNMHPITSHAITLGDWQYDDEECTLPMCVHHHTAKHGCDHLDTINRIWIHLKKYNLTIRAPRFILDHTIESVCDAASRESQPWSPC
ncbi:hypothetical protein TNCV_3715221 [Trichonephila clavipes]|nr:hypothetical protein TNCV_3715221 [Trichonephila clavipes]